MPTACRGRTQQRATSGGAGLTRLHLPEERLEVGVERAIDATHPRVLRRATVYLPLGGRRPAHQSVYEPTEGVYDDGQRRPE